MDPVWLRRKDASAYLPTSPPRQRTFGPPGE